MVVALADSFFFDVDPSGARSKVLGFLLVSFAPFLVLAPFIGPAIDRVRGGRRFIVQAVADYASSVMNPFLSTHKEIIGLLLPVKFSDTPVETIDSKDADILGALLSALVDEGRQR